MNTFRTRGIEFIFNVDDTHGLCNDALRYIHMIELRSILLGVDSETSVRKKDHGVRKDHVNYALSTANKSGNRAQSSQIQRRGLDQRRTLMQVPN